MKFAREAKIVFVNRYFYPDLSATSQLLTDLAAALAASGFPVHIICSRQRYDDPSARLARLEWIGRVCVHRVRTTRFGRDRLLGRALDYATFYLSSTIAMLRLLARDDTVIAKTDPPLLSIAAMLAARLKGAQQINWLQDIFPEVATRLGANPLPGPLDKLLRHCRDGSLRFARVNVVLGERMREQLQLKGIPPGTIRVIENWAELAPDKPKPAGHSRLRSQLGLSDQFVVGYSGNLGRAHEFQTMLSAATLLRADPGIVFLMIGGGTGMGRLAQAVAELGLTNFRFLPYQPREAVADALAAADAHWVSLLPDLEGFIVPSKFYGILAAARPVLFIGDPDGELAREIGKCHCGAAVPVGDAQGAVRHLAAWRADVGLREQIGRNGEEAYHRRFCAERAFAQWNAVLTQPGRAVDAGVQSPSGR
ncbi:MAG TPA: glycosyltransferase family 4 protein [Steroidobacteraceae bacterium]